MSDFSPGHWVHMEPIHLVIHHYIDTMEGLVDVGPSSIFMVWNMWRWKALLETFHLPPGRRESLYFPQTLEMQLSTDLIKTDLWYSVRDLASLPVQTFQTFPFRNAHCITALKFILKSQDLKDGVSKESGLFQPAATYHPSSFIMTRGDYENQTMWFREDLKTCMMLLDT